MLDLSSRPARALFIAIAATALALILTNPPAQAAPRQVTAGTLTWGIKATFRSYVTGPTAHGAIAVTGGASQNADGTFRFPAAGGSYDNAGATSVNFSGTVRFTGHDGQLDLTVANPRLQITGGMASLIADVASKQLNSGTTANYPGVSLAAITASAPTETAAAVNWNAMPSTMSAAGSPIFGGFYNAGTPMDPVSLALTLAAAPVLANTPLPSTATRTLPSIGFLATSTPVGFFVAPVATPTVFVPANIQASANTTTTSNITQPTTSGSTQSTTGTTSAVLGVTSQSNAPIRPPTTGDAGLAVDSAAAEGVQLQ